MEHQKIFISLAGLAVGYYVGYHFLSKYNKKGFDFESCDQSYAEQLLGELHSDMLRFSREITDQKLTEHFAAGEVMLAKHPKTELLGLDGPADTRYWPYYHYTFPYQHTEGGAWPPNMYTRLYNWQPGYETSGWSYWMRPGISYARWPRNRWVRNNGSFYFINHGNDRSKDFL